MALNSKHLPPCIHCRHAFPATIGPNVQHDAGLVSSHSQRVRKGRIVDACMYGQLGAKAESSMNGPQRDA
jgi:hypothetical protein